jgi:hypothetical protein
VNNLERSTKVSKQLRYLNKKLLKTAQSAPAKLASPIYRSYPKGVRSLNFTRLTAQRTDNGGAASCSE